MYTSSLNKEFPYILYAYICTYIHTNIHRVILLHTYTGDMANATEYCTWLMHPECRISFDTFDELFHLIKTLDDKAIGNVR